MEFTTYVYNLVRFSRSFIFSHKNNGLSTKSERFNVCITCQMPFLISWPILWTLLYRNRTRQGCYCYTAVYDSRSPDASLTCFLYTDSVHWSLHKTQFQVNSQNKLECRTKWPYIKWWKDELQNLCNISLPIGEIRVAVNPCNWFEILKIKF